MGVSLNYLNRKEYGLPILSAIPEAQPYRRRRAKGEAADHASIEKPRSTRRPGMRVAADCEDADARTQIAKPASTVNPT